jgi:rhamnose utilization protein RhaD (predicted bifunctional aldolase and dehydrogenase)/NAD(P)-dependent dehydrogenase (short-subunit alcohol dehydrogenase family)
MRSLWNDAEAASFDGPLAQRVYTSRLLGRDKALVLHGGGNTSVKLGVPNLFGEVEDILYIKGSGWDLETIEQAGFSPVRLDRARRLATLEHLSDTHMVRELRAAMTDPGAPTPSVETILHASLPFPFVDHTHADALLAMTNTADGEQRVRDAFGKSVVVIPYVMPGFDLARCVAREFPHQAGPETRGMVLLQHGFFSWGETAREAYERMIDLVSRAEEYLDRHGAWQISLPRPSAHTPARREEVAALRKQASDVAGFPLILVTHTDARSMSFVQRDDLPQVSQQGPATPDHVIRTKRLPQLGRDVAAFAAEYERYFQGHASGSLQILDRAPRVILDPELGVATLGRTARDAAIAFEVFEHTIDVISRGTALGGYRALPAADIFAVEYWDLEQAKLRRGGSPPPFAGEVALVTGAASGIGKATVESLLARGSAVVGVDINPAIAELHRRADFVGLTCDLTDASSVDQALESAVRAYGGLDMLVLNAGIFGASRRIAALDLQEWRTVMSINLDANVALLRAAHPLLAESPRGGRVVVIGSKNVPAPGPGAAAYSASKAALNQLARVAALEWGADRIRVNVIHPNAVFDTGLWTEEVLASRAQSYRLTVDEYRRNNVLHVEVTSRAVAELAAEMCGPLFAKTTGAQVPVDGGNDRVI